MYCQAVEQCNKTMKTKKQNLKPLHHSFSLLNCIFLMTPLTWTSVTSTMLHQCMTIDAAFCNNLPYVTTVGAPCSGNDGGEGITQFNASYISQTVPNM